MKARVFLTLGQELMAIAESLAAYFEGRGYRVVVEPRELGYPFVPAFVCKLRHTTKIVDLCTEPDFGRLDYWARYARSCSGDTRIAIGVPAALANDVEEKVRAAGAGLYVVTSVGAIEKIAPRDLALNLALPNIAMEPPKIRELMGPAYEQFESSHWREGFEDACQTLEVQARKYLIKGMRAGRITFRNKDGSARKVPEAKVNKMPLGPLAKEFGRIAVPNQTDSQIERALLRVNKDRIGVAHKKDSPRAEASLRKNVGQHMWLVLAALKLIHP